VTLPAATEDIRPINVTVASESVDWLPSTVVLTSSNLRMPPTADGSETQLSAPPEAIALSEFLNVDVGERVSRSLDLQTRDIARKSERRRGAFLPTDLPSATLLDASLAAAPETMQNDGPDFSGEARPETDSSDWACWTKMIAPILIGGSLPVLWHWLQSRVTSRAIRRVQ
jgi:hypothetical protein